jgi:hypothetical protein
VTYSVASQGSTGDFVFSAGIDGALYKVSKQDISRHLLKTKEKMKSKQVGRCLKFIQNKGGVEVLLGEDEKEK